MASVVGLRWQESPWGWFNPGNPGEGASLTGEDGCPDGGYPNCNLIANLLPEVVCERNADHHDGVS